jgi:hypothetical protein
MNKIETHKVKISIPPEEVAKLHVEITKIGGRIMAHERKRKNVMELSLKAIRELKLKQNELIEMATSGCREEERQCPMEHDFNAGVVRTRHPETMEVFDTRPMTEEELQVNIEDEIEEEENADSKLTD